MRIQRFRQATGLPLEKSPWAEARGMETAPEGAVADETGTVFLKTEDGFFEKPAEEEIRRLNPEGLEALWGRNYIFAYWLPVGKKVEGDFALHRIEEWDGEIIRRLGSGCYTRYNPSLQGEGDAARFLTLAVCEAWAEVVLRGYAPEEIAADLLDCGTRPESLRLLAEAVEDFLGRHRRLREACAPVGSGRLQANDCGGRVGAAWRVVWEAAAVSALIERGVRGYFYPRDYGRYSREAREEFQREVFPHLLTLVDSTHQGVTDAVRETLAAIEREEVEAD